ncbi:hypothetical protein RND81_02G095800 [Saponaria officinalis]|uniref:RING-type E3 ubiquitin transferase n=1 Tax=Saponaria officinalis TaxID=3572 RepID=A0AAW1MLS8_SAPOF
MFVHSHPTHGIVLGLSLLTKLATAQQPSPPSPNSSLPPPPPPYSFSPPMATAVIVLIIIFFSIGFLSVYLRHLLLCLGLRLGSDPGGNQGWTRDRRQSRGLDPTKVDTFPTFLFSDVKTHRIGKSSLECAICLNEFTEIELLRMLPSCCHVFHPQCIGPWLTSHVTCPVCRANLEFHSSRRSFDYLVNQLDQSSDEDESNPSGNPDVIIPLGASPEIKSPVLQEIKSLDGLTRKLPRSHSTGHSVVEDCERYTLRLPEEVRNKLVNVNLSGLPAAIVSPRVGYRARSVGCTKNDGIKPDHWRFSVSPPFISRSSSTKSTKSYAENNTGNNNDNNNNSNNSSGGIINGPKNLFKSIKSPFNRVTRSDDIGERSTNRLWDNRTNQDLELEAQWHQNQ